MVEAGKTERERESRGESKRGKQVRKEETRRCGNKENSADSGNEKNWQPLINLFRSDRVN